MGSVLEACWFGSCFDCWRAGWLSGAVACLSLGVPCLGCSLFDCWRAVGFLLERCFSLSLVSSVGFAVC